MRAGPSIKFIGVPKPPSRAPLIGVITVLSFGSPSAKVAVLRTSTSAVVPTRASEPVALRRTSLRLACFLLIGVLERPFIWPLMPLGLRTQLLGIRRRLRPPPMATTFTVETALFALVRKAALPAPLYRPSLAVLLLGVTAMLAFEQFDAILIPPTTRPRKRMLMFALTRTVDKIPRPLLTRPIVMALEKPSLRLPRKFHIWVSWLTTALRKTLLPSRQ